MRLGQEPRCLRILGGSDPRMREAIVQLCTMRAVRAGETVQHEADTARYVGFVAEGVLRLVKYRPDGHQHIIGLLYEDSMFGRLFDRMPPLSVEASTDAVICVFDRMAFEALMLQYPALEHRMLMAVCDELDAAHEGMLILSTPRKGERVATFLLQLWRHARARSPASEVTTIALPVSRVDIAHYLGTAPETISRILTSFARSRVIEMADRRSVRIIDPGRLVALSGWDPSDWADLVGTDTRRAGEGAPRAPRVLPWPPPRRAAKRSGGMEA